LSFDLPYLRTFVLIPIFSVLVDMEENVGRSRLGRESRAHVSEDLTEVHKWNWGAAALVYLQGYMADSTKWRCGQMAGDMSLLHV
jgi:hypothetical protein